MMRWKKRAFLACAAALVAVGCAGGDTETVTAASFVSDAAPLPTIEREIWQAAVAGCEGRIDEIVEFGIAEEAPELVVAIDRNGIGERIVCVDSYSAVESELQEMGSDEIDALWLGYVASLQEVEPLSAENPQPRARRDRESPVPDLGSALDRASAEPQPQPNIEGDLDPAASEPQPQPNDPTGGESGSAGSSSSGSSSSGSGSRASSSMDSGSAPSGGGMDVGGMGDHPAPIAPAT